MRAHLRTLRPLLRHALRPHRPPPAEPWSTEVADPERGTLRLTGDLRRVAGSRELVVLVHGLGSRPDAVPCLRAAEVLAAGGVSTLSLALRGSDLLGEDFYNVALTADLHAALASRELASFERLFVLGYSMGGYVALHLACEPADPRLLGVAAVSSPLDLGAAQVHIDSPRAWFYRRRVLRGLVAIYEEVARRRSVPTPPERVRRVRTIHEWDALTIAPRYGYDSPEHYYRELSVVPRLPELRVPALLLAGREDPIIPPSTIEPFLNGGRVPRGGAHELSLHWIERAGHLALPRDLDLGMGPVPGLESQVFQWFRSRDSVSAAHPSPR